MKIFLAIVLSILTIHYNSIFVLMKELLGESPQEEYFTKTTYSFCDPRNDNCLRKECPRKPNEQYDPCLARCQRSCDNIYKTAYRPCYGCFAGCICSVGYARDDTGRCIPIYLCNRNQKLASRPWISQKQSNRLTKTVETPTPKEKEVNRRR